MMRTWKSYRPERIENINASLLQLAKQFDHFLFLDSCKNTAYGKNKFECLLAAGRLHVLETNAGNAFVQLKQFLDHHNDWCFGYFGYDLKNETEQLSSQHPDRIGFSDLCFFIPEIIVLADEDIRIGVTQHQHDAVFEQMLHDQHLPVINDQPVTLKARIEKADYLQKVEAVRRHIVDGDIYEINLCQEFFSESAVIDPFAVFQQLCDFSKAPFSSLLRWDEHYLISASPERFMQKQGERILSQPMKGTMPRSADTEHDEQLKRQLSASEKDKAENVMIVDLVRNDLTRSCKTGSIRVDELFGIYTFEQVHQMVSTISGELKPGMHVVDALKNAFPMGSMTGAPKVMAMRLIEQYETTKRGLFSGSIGYFMPVETGYDFDFNVIIRSILYHAAKQSVSVQVGSAIVFDSVAEEEYKECLTKLAALEHILNGRLR